MDWSLQAAEAVAGDQASGAASAIASSQRADALFGRLMERELSDVNASIAAAETAMRDVAAGKPVELHDVMIRLEKARISVQAFVQVRNKVVESYQDLMRMQM